MPVFLSGSFGGLLTRSPSLSAFSGTLLVRNLNEIAAKSNLVNTEYISTLLVVVPKYERPSRLAERPFAHSLVL